MIVGLAGHVDHGKSALVTALTGIATDRAPEARARGITIDLQAVALRDAAGRPVAALIDVPGHEDFIRAMVAGASGVAAILLVVAADEGIMPQTREHLLIAERLGIRGGIVVITKTDLVEAAWLELVAADLMEQLAGSPLSFGAPSSVSARTGQGIDSLRDRILELAGRATPPRTDDLFRLPVDKVFSRAGIGTIVTGTAWSGSVRIGDAVRLLPDDGILRVRSLENHGDAVIEAHAGQRVAIGIAGLEREQAGRGRVLVHADAPWRTVTACDAMVDLDSSAPRRVLPHRRVMVHHGTASVGGRLIPRAPIIPGGSGLARIILDQPLVLRGGDRAVLRSWSPATTIGGLAVLDPAPPPRATWPDDLASADPRSRLGALAARRRHGLLRDDVPVVLGVRPCDVDAMIDAPGIAPLADRLVAPARRAALEAQALATLRAYHRDRPDEKGLSVETLRRSLDGPDVLADAIVERLCLAGKVKADNGRARLATFAATPALSALEADLLVSAIRAAGLAAPPAVELAGAFPEAVVVTACRVAEGRGLVRMIERGRWVGAEHLHGFVALLRDIGSRGRITLAAVRDRTGLSRKYLIPLLEWADREGLTRRDGDDRVWIQSRSP